MKSLSVIIPGYNTRREWWARSVESVLRKGGVEDVEIICVDDGSKVPLTELNLPCFQDGRVRILRLDVNVGQAVGRNRALEMATGKYVAFVDSDDEIVGDIYKQCIDKLERTNGDVCLFGVQVIWPRERLTKFDVPETSDVCVPSGALVEKWFKGCVLNYISNKVIRRDFLERNHIRFNPDGMPCEDVMFYLEALTKGAKWCALDRVGYVYYRYSTTSLSQYKACHQKGTIACAEVWKRFCATREDGEESCGYHARPTAAMLAGAEWENIWRLKSPYGFADKYRWLIAHREELGASNLAAFFIRKAAISFIRHYFYVLPIRKRHYRRVYEGLEKL